MPQRLDANDLVNLVHDSCHVRVDLVVFCAFVSSVACYETLTDEITRKDDPDVTGVLEFVLEVVDSEIFVLEAIGRW